MLKKHDNIIILAVSDLFAPGALVNIVSYKFTRPYFTDDLTPSWIWLVILPFFLLQLADH